MEINVKEARRKISSLLDQTEKGEDIVIIRRGKRVAKLVAFSDTGKTLPDLQKFRDTISVRGERLSEAIIQGRKEERY